MSKMEILAELPKLELAKRDRELAEYRQNPEAGSSWNEVEARIRKSPACFSAQII
jgi:hypothetical protein